MSSWLRGSWLVLVSAALMVAVPACQWEVPLDPFPDSGIDGPEPDAGTDGAVDAPTDGMPMATLTVIRNGTASGTITSNAVGGSMIDCGATCTAQFPPGTLITLTEAPGTGATFAGWTGICNDTAPNCSFTLDSDTTVQATFDVSRHTITITPTGNGIGNVISSVGGIACPGTCETTVDYGTMVTLTATPTSPSIFAGWNDVGCTGTSPCTFTVTQDEVIDASFALNYTVTVSKNGNGRGTVTSSVPGIMCGSDCDQVYSAGTMVTLTAAPDSDSDFTGWDGACSGMGTCTVTVNSVVAVTANFALKRYTLTASRAGTGGGVVTSNPTGINCGTDCTEMYDHGQQVTLAAMADGSSTFMGWSDAACTGTGACVVTMTGARSVAATFTLNRYPLTVARAGNGASLGMVTSAPMGITCGSDCDELYDANSMVTLSAGAATGATFMGWSGAGCMGTGNCVVTMSGAQSVTALFTLNQYTLSVNKTGNGASLGTVTSNGGSITCGATCSAQYEFGQSVTLTPAVMNGAIFMGWSGGGCSGNGNCVVTIGGDTAVTANFILDNYTLAVVRAGNAAGTGSVTSAPAGITCDAAMNDCDHTYTFGTAVTLTPTAGAGSSFGGWSGGGCSGMDPCVVTVDAAKTVTATFTLDEALTVTKAGTGPQYGTVTSSPAGITCGNDCSENFNVGEMVTLTASVTAGAATFEGWSGACSGTGACTVTVSAATNVIATFDLVPYLLTVAKTGDGTGSIESTDLGINCGNDCTQSYGYGTSSVLSATADAGSTFIGWSGGGCSGRDPCTVTVTAAQTVTAIFQADRVLTVTTAGNGTGGVTSSQGGIACPGDCTQTYSHGTTMTMSAVAGTGSMFTGWSGACSGTGICSITMNGMRTVQATFELTRHPLTVSRAGSGAALGTVTSPSGINCGIDCSETLDYGTQVTLSASAAPGATFVGWSGDCSGTGACLVTVSGATAVTANFEADKTLTVVRAGTGSAYGLVTSTSHVGINCGNDCSEAYPYNDLVELTASVPIGAAATFGSWSGGGCSGSQSTCIVPMDQAQTVVATFNIRKHTVSVATNGGNGSGTVVSDPAGISAPTTPSASFDYGSTVTLDATASTGSNFSGWAVAGAPMACSGTGSCGIVVDGAKSVTATFTLQQFPLGVTKTGTGTALGTVTSTPGGINCGATCSAPFNYNQPVQLSVTEMAGTRFMGWSGEMCSGTGVCAVTMTQARNVAAAFEADKILTVSLQGNGSGMVVSSDGAIMAPGTPSAAFRHGTLVTLTATPNLTTSDFVDWGGACDGIPVTDACVVTMDQARDVTATFTLKTYTLALNKVDIGDATGTGTVTSNVAGINCAPACTTQSATYNYGQSVELGYVVGTDSEFMGWGGDCSSSPCSVSMTQDHTVTATFQRTDKLLTVTLAGNGAGIVVSTPGGIMAPGSTMASFTHGDVVTLTATANMTTSNFVDWGGACDSFLPTESCVVTMDQAQGVTATFTLKTYTLTVNKTGAGTGTVTSDIGGINCDAACATQSATYNHGATPTLSHFDGAGSEFVAWGGDCAGATCMPSMTANRTVTANFKLTDKLLTVEIDSAGTGTGTVTSDDGGIDSPSDPTQSYAHGTSVTLRAVPTSSTSDFESWSGDGCSGSVTPCTVSMTQARMIKAKFKLKIRTLTVAKDGFGSGTVTSTMPANAIDCGSDCTENVNHGTMVTLTATAGPGDVFYGWSGGGCSGAGNCTVSVTAATTVTATFDQCDRTQAELCTDATSFYEACTASGQSTRTMTCSLGCSTTNEKCLELVPSNGLTSYLDMTETAPAVSLTGTSTINTSTGQICVGATCDCFGSAPCGPVPSAVVSGMRVFMVSSLSISGTAKVSGTAPLVFLSYGDVNITGVLDVSGDTGIHGPGAITGASTCHGGSQPAQNPSPGGGGAGRAGSGGQGGFTGTNAPGGTAGAAISDSTLTPLQGGCFGGDSMYPMPPFQVIAAGGSAGGAVQIVSRTSVNVLNAGAVDASGGGGQSTSGAGGGGGGSGGGILIEAPTVVINGANAVLSTKGGGGGGAQTSSPVPGEDGGTGPNPAVGGSNGTTASGGFGGDGTSSPSAGVMGSGPSGDGGGGGGAAGFTRINTRTGAGSLNIGGGGAIRSVRTTGVLPSRQYP